MSTMQNIFKNYQERLVNLTRNKTIFLNKTYKNHSFDLSGLLNKEQVGLVNFLENRSDKKHKLVTISASTPETKSIYTTLNSIDKEAKNLFKETGRFEMYIGYPFLEGKFFNDKPLRAPILLFPIVLEKNLKSFYIKHDIKQNVIFNPSLLSAFQIFSHTKFNGLEEDIYDFTSIKKEVNKIISQIEENSEGLDLGNKLDFENFSQLNSKSTKEVLDTYTQDKFALKNYAILGRFGAADNSLYAEYSALIEKNKIKNEPMKKLLFGTTQKFNESASSQKDESKIDTMSEGDLFRVNNLDYSQEQIVYESSSDKNIVMHGPPGTGKSQTISNVIAHNLMLGKKILVVSEKRAALDVIYNRLPFFQDKIAVIHDYRLDKEAFYEKLEPRIEDESIEGQNLLIPKDEKNYDNDTKNGRSIKISEEYFKNINKVDNNINALVELFDAANNKHQNGLTLYEMYQKSEFITRDKEHFDQYLEIQKNNHFKQLTNIEYTKVEDAIEKFKSKELLNSIVKRKKLEKHYPNIELFDKDHSLAEIYQIEAKAKQLFDKYSNASMFEKKYIIYEIKKLVAYMVDKNNEQYLNKKIGSISRLLIRLKLKKLKLKKHAYKNEVAQLFNYFKNEENSIRIFEKFDQYHEAMSYLNTLNETEKIVYSLIYELAYSAFTEARGLITQLHNYILNKVIGEIEGKEQSTLSKSKEFKNLTAEIDSLINRKNQETIININEEWNEKFKKAVNNADKELKRLVRAKRKKSIREFVHKYKDVAFTAFPVWLLSPESVSSTLPLEDGLFDLVIYDEASQLFIERAIPSLYRGKHCLVGGDTKQLRPSSIFQFRAQLDDDFDFAALVEESLLDLAVNCFDEVYLRYHYRSQFEELINFSNYAFYNGQLTICPNMNAPKEKPVEYIKVENGVWSNQENPNEAHAVVDLVVKLLSRRRNDETIGIVTFNSKQKDLIKGLLDKQAIKDKVFAKKYSQELARTENDEDISLFVKNIENVQGDERDIIIFSIAYARNEQGKVVNQFGTLSQEGGENRLNVAVSRAKKKVYVVASIEPEELPVHEHMSLGAKMFKKYLQYAKYISDGRKEELQTLLESFTKKTQTDNIVIKRGLTFEERVAKKLNEYLIGLKSSYEFHTHVGSSKYKIGLALYDKSKKHYVLGIEADGSTYREIKSIRERDLYRPNYLVNRGWNLMRLWSSDWWRDEERSTQEILQQILKI